jgi:copper(I)-binding protein
VIGRGLAALAVVVALLAGCSEPQEVIGSGANGADGEVGDVLLRGVRIQGTESALRPGDDATAWLTLIAETTRDTLTGVTSDVASRMEIRWDRGCDGTAEPVDELPLAANVGGPADPSRPGADESASYHLRVIDVTREILVGTTVPMTFRFARAGEITLQVPVVADTEARAYPSARCSVLSPS